MGPNGPECKTTEKKRLRGPELAAWIRRASPVTRICIGAAIMSGELELTNPTIAQVARLLGIKSKQIRAIAQLTPEQRAALTDRRRLNGATHLSNDMLDDLVAKVGTGRVMAALDRATMPMRQAAG
jgi:hypothetical protein